MTEPLRFPDLARDEDEGLIQPRYQTDSWFGSTAPDRRRLLQAVTLQIDGQA